MKILQGAALHKKILFTITIAIIVIGTSGLLLFIPPFSIPPLSAYFLFFHELTGLIVILPFLLTLIIHGVPKRKTHTVKKLYMCTGALWGLIFLFCAGTGVFAYFAASPPWLYVVHIISGVSALILSLFHGCQHHPEQHRRSSQNDFHRK
jgi:hypothetical protein